MHSGGDEFEYGILEYYILYAVGDLIRHIRPKSDNTAAREQDEKEKREKEKERECDRDGWKRAAVNCFMSVIYTYTAQ